MNVRDTQIVDLDWGGKVVFVNCIVGGAIDARFLPAILKGIMARMEQGPLTGSYARDVRICVYDGKMHPAAVAIISFALPDAMRSVPLSRRLALRSWSLFTMSRFPFLLIIWEM